MKKIKMPRKKIILKIKKPSFKIYVNCRKYENFIKVIRFLDNYKFFFLFVLWNTFIFMFSNQEAYKSAELSSNVFNNLTEFSFFKLLFSIFPIRKCGHFFLFFILGIITFLHFRYRTDYPHIVSIIVCYFCGCFDEFHQLFVPGRGALVMDTFIDLSGSICGIIVISIILFILCTYLAYKDYALYNSNSGY